VKGLQRWPFAGSRQSEGRRGPAGQRIRRLAAAPLGIALLAASAAIGAGPAGAATPPPSTPCAIGSSAPCQQAFFQVSKASGAVTGAIALPGSDVEGQDYDGVVCQGAGSGQCFLAGDRNGFLLMTFNSFACNPVASETPVGAPAGFTIDAMGWDPATTTLYAAVGDQLSTVNTKTGAITQTSDWMGHAAGSKGTVELDRLDALAYDPASSDLLGIVDQGNASPLLVHLDPATGGVIHDAFGSGDDYVTVQPDGGRSAVTGLVVTGGIAYVAISNNDANATDPHLAALNPATGATSDIGAFGVPTIGALTADSSGNLFAVAGTGGAVVQSLPCPSPTPAAPVTSTASAVLGVQANRPGAPVEPTLPVTGFDAFPLALVAAACLATGAGTLALSRRRPAPQPAGGTPAGCPEEQA
jgi:hypothetical protein